MQLISKKVWYDISKYSFIRFPHLWLEMLHFNICFDSSLILRIRSFLTLWNVFLIWKVNKHMDHTSISSIIIYLFNTVFIITVFLDRHTWIFSCNKQSHSSTSNTRKLACYIAVSCYIVPLFGRGIDMWF